jgi:predicted ATPase/DNA-binding XRE family transcriptional regulator
MRDSLAFGLQLKQQRRAQDLTQAMLARQVGCAEITIQKIEAGTLRPSRQIAERLAEMLSLAAEERIRFIALARGEASAAPLPSSRLRPLPIPPTPLIGRHQETAAVCATLLRNDVRLLTLIGAPGVGKTRLALAVARQMGEPFADGVVWVNLAPLDNPGQVLPAIAHSLNLPERADRQLDERLKSVLHQRKLLLLLDNFEHLVTAAPHLTDLLAGAGAFKLLVTSRVVLHVSGEHVYGLGPLPLPDLAAAHTAATLAGQPAVALFVARARAVKPDFALTTANAQAIAAICVRLDGLPLAIELAAAHSTLFSPPTLLKRLEQRLVLLTGGAQDLPTRQQTLRGAIDWSYHLLNEREQTLFARLAVFAGGCTLEAVEMVCSSQAPDTLDLLAVLLDQSLVQQIDGGAGEPRFTLLDTLREYAQERLAGRGELAPMQRWHAEYLLALAEQAEPAFEGAARAQQQAWLQRFDQEHDNVRAALHWCYTTPEGIQTGIRLTAAIWQFWWIRGHLTEGRGWVAQALAQAPAATCLRAKLLNQAGFLAFSQGDYAAAGHCHEESLALASGPRGHPDDRQAIGDACIGLANLAERQSDYRRAEQLFAQSAALFQATGDTSSYAWSLVGMANMARIFGDYARTRALLEEGRSHFETLGYQRGLAYVLHDLGRLAHDEGEFATAQARYRESLALFSELAERPALAAVHTSLGHAALRQGDPGQAMVHYRQSLALCRELADRAGSAGNLMGLASAAAAQGEARQAAQWWGAAERLRETIGLTLLPAEQADYTSDVAAARAQGAPTNAAFEAAWQAGRTLPLDEVIAGAIGGRLPR